MYYSTQYVSPVGKLTLASDGAALAGLWLEGQKYFGGAIAKELVPDDGLAFFTEARRWLDCYFAGERPAPDELPLAPVGTAYQQLVWKLLRDIPYGQTATYGSIAAEAGRRQGRSTCGRAVGSAVGRNPISIIIPCHRVLGSGGQLTGYAGGLERKIWLLKHEGIELK